MKLSPRHLSHYPNMDTGFPFYIKIEKASLVTPHRHDFLELLLVVQGSGTETINGIPHRMEPGTFVLLLPYQIHEIVSNPDDPLTSYVCNFDLDLLLGTDRGENGLESLIFNHQDHLPSYVLLKDGEAQHTSMLLEGMFAEYRQNERWKNVIIKSRLLEALALFDRNRQHGMHHQDTVNPGSQKSIWQVIQHVHHHFRDDLTLSGLARQYHFHPSHLSELFKQTIGENFHCFLRDLRLRHACSLLLTTKMTASDIAMEVGFGSFQTFHRTFRKFKGMPPTKYRQLKIDMS